MKSNFLSFIHQRAPAIDRVIASIRRGIDRLSVMPRGRWWVLLAVVALGTRLAWAAGVRDRAPQFDETRYIAHAVDLLDGRGYVDSQGVATAYWPVGYPAVLAAAYRVFGPGKAVGVLLQTGLSVATCFLLAAIGSSAFGPGTGRAAALLLAAYPNHVVYSTLHLTEPLSTFLLLLAVFLSLRPNSLLAVGATGVVIGLASLVRPLFILLPGALAIWYWRIVPGRAGALLRTAMVGLFTVLAVSPWVIRNHAVTGRWLTLSTNGGRVFWMGNYPGAFGGYKHDHEINNQLRVGDSLNYDEGYRLGMDAILDAPVEAGVRIVRKLTYLVALETDGVLWNLKGLERTTPLWLRLLLLGLANACYLAVVTFAILGVLRGPRRDPLATMLVVLAGLSFVTAAIFLGDPRYHYALIPLACLFAIKGVADDLPQLLRHDPSRSAGRPVWATWALSTGVFAAMVVANAVIKVVEVRTLGS